MNLGFGSDVTAYMAVGRLLLRKHLAAVAVAAVGLWFHAGAASAFPAYVTNFGDPTLTVFDTTSNLPATGPAVGAEAIDVAITPDGRFAYVVNQGSQGVSVVETATNRVVVPKIAVGKTPKAVAITPDGRFAYVAVADTESVAVIDIATNAVVVPEIKVAQLPRSIAITPDGRFAYVANQFSDNVSVINTATNQPLNKKISVGKGPDAIAITPDGRFAYVALAGNESVTVIDIETNQVVVPEIGVGSFPSSIAITPDGRFAYVVNASLNGVSVIDTAENKVVGPELRVGKSPRDIAITPDGSRAYVVNVIEGSVSVIKTQGNLVLGEEIATGIGPIAVAIGPDQGPVASFAVAADTPSSVPLGFDASASSDPDGRVASYVWDFGDGQTETLGVPRTTHAFARPGVYQVTLRVTDAEGCSTAETSRFTGQTASCNGSSSAQTTQTVRVVAAGGSNAFRFGKLALNRKRGTATLPVVLPGPGLVLLKGVGLAAAGKSVGAAGTVKLPIRSTGRASKRLAASGKVRLRMRVTFAPDGGSAATMEKSLVLRRQRRSVK